MKLHPIRASLAVGVVAATIYMMAVGMVIPEAWWVALGAVITFYFTSND